MRDWTAPLGLRFGVSTLVLACALLDANAAHADLDSALVVQKEAVGKIKISVKNAKDGKPLPRVKIIIQDATGKFPTATLFTDTAGNALTPDLNAQEWQVTSNAEMPDTYEPDTRRVNVIANTITVLDLTLEPVVERVIRVITVRRTIRAGQTENGTVRNREFIAKLPGGGGNPSDINKVLKSTAGATADSANQIHVRGEHGATSVYLDGFYLPSPLQGRVGETVSPNIIQSVDVLTGAFAPEYGGETAAILDIGVRTGTPRSTIEGTAEGGNFSTFDGGFSLSGQAGVAKGLPDAKGRTQRRFGYFVDVSARRSMNFLEPPQPDNQTAHNTGASLTGFGNFSYEPNSRDTFKLALSSSPATAQIANRAGLPSYFADAGQGYGYIGHLSAADAAAQGIVSQDAAGQDITQRDIYDFGVLSFTHRFNSKFNGVIAFGSTHSGQDVTNNNPAINLNALPDDASIEFNPTISRNNHQNQLQGSLTYALPKHRIKAGILLNDQEGDESYNLIPASQLALNALASSAPALAPAGSFQTDAQGNPVLDSVGNKVYTLAPGATVPTVNVHRAGFYRAAYVQDTWNISKRATLNYGLRFDWYKQSESLGLDTVNQKNLSPRINFAYSLDSRMVGRIAYNRILIQPPLAQGNVIGQPITPETLDQFDVSVDRQIANGQTLKLAYYYKEIQGQIDTGLLIPFTQIGVYSSVTFQRGHSRGLELSYELSPKNNVGLSAYLSYSHGLNKPTGVQNTGDPVPLYNDHDQLNTLNSGLSYTLKSGANASLNVSYGSGLASSVVFADANGNGKRSPHTQVDVSLGTGDRWFRGGHGGVSLSVQNVFDSRDVLNFNSGFSGTRFWSGRRVLLSASFKF